MGCRHGPPALPLQHAEFDHQRGLRGRQRSVSFGRGEWIHRSLGIANLSGIAARHPGRSGKCAPRGVRRARLNVPRATGPAWTGRIGMIVFKPVRSLVGPGDDRWSSIRRCGRRVGGAFVGKGPGWLRLAGCIRRPVCRFVACVIACLFSFAWPAGRARLLVRSLRPLGSNGPYLARRHGPGPHPCRGWGSRQRAGNAGGSAPLSGLGGCFRSEAPACGCLAAVALAAVLNGIFVAFRLAAFVGLW